MPGNYVVNGVWLHKWLSEQKLIAEGRRKKTHTPEQLAKLEAIGLRYGAIFYEEQWNERFEMAKAYFVEHGDLNVSIKYTVGDCKLGVWIRQQRSQYRDGNMPADHAERLNAIGMEWRSSADASYETGFEHLREYLSVHDAVPPDAECKDGYKLGIWLSNCKRKYKTGKLKQEYYDRFTELGIVLDAKKTDTWPQYADEVEAYFAEHNVKYLPKNLIGKSGNNLWMWLEDQKKR